MEKIFQLLIILILVSSCGNSQNTEQLKLDKVELKKELEVKELKVKESTKLLNEVIKQHCSVETGSKQLMKIIDFLTSIDYEYELILKTSNLIFDYKDWGKTFKAVESIEYENCKHIEYRFKKKTPIKGNFYPKFKIIEFCFDSPLKASEYQKKITHILNRQEKNYGYILLNNNRLIYTQTGVNKYGFIINDLKAEFEKKIKTFANTI